MENDRDILQDFAQRIAATLQWKPEYLVPLCIEILTDANCHDEAGGLLAMYIRSNVMIDCSASQVTRFLFPRFVERLLERYLVPGAR